MALCICFNWTILAGGYLRGGNQNKQVRDRQSKLAILDAPFYLLRKIEFTTVPSDKSCLADGSFRCERTLLKIGRVCGGIVYFGLNCASVRRVIEGIIMILSCIIRRNNDVYFLQSYLILCIASVSS